jgi:DHA1 family bicyclomycin/chloramphenicol resistance-like MFS transporter
MAEDATAVSWVVTALFLGMAIGPWFFGPASDRYGRKAPMSIGLVIYVLAACATLFAPTFGAFIALRVVWGIGASAPAALAMAMVRDLYDGDAMARVMSMVMAAFMLVPAAAPSVGTGIIAVVPWQSLLVIQAAFGAVLLVWTRRMPETLHPEHRRPFTWQALGVGVRVVLTTRATLMFTLAAMLLMGIMTGYIGSIELILDDVYDVAFLFPIMFAVNALLQALSSLNNARVVRRTGLNRLIRRLSVAACISSGALALTAVIAGGRPHVALLWAGFAAVLIVVQNLMPNCNAGAMLPVPQIAGTASAVMSTMTTAGGALLGAIISGQVHGSVTPLVVSVFALSVGTLAVTLMATRRTPAAAAAEPVDVVPAHF